MAGTSTLQQQVTRLNSAVAIPPVGARNTIDLDLVANRRQEPRARDAVGPDDIGAEIHITRGTQRRSLARRRRPARTHRR